MIIQIKNMESERCKTIVKNELDKLGINYKRVELGEVILKNKLSIEKLKIFDSALRISGLELIVNKKKLLIEKIKVAINQLINLPDGIPKPNISEYISKEVNYDYTFISNLFSGMQGMTIEKYIIEQKIERVKELLVYDKLNLSDIAYKMQYSSVAHLSNQFKKITGLTPSFFRQARNNKYRK